MSKTTKKEIIVNCHGAALMEISKLKSFQGDLKKISVENINRLKTNMIRHGFIAPIFIWKTKKGSHYILDGHQRIKALESLKTDGHKIPSKLPIDYIEADNKKQAKERLLGITSRFGEFDRTGLDLFLEELDIETLSREVTLSDGEMDLKLPEIDINEFIGGEVKIDKKVKTTTCPYCGKEFAI
jgi:hypothetical protein